MTNEGRPGGQRFFNYFLAVASRALSAPAPGGLGAGGLGPGPPPGVVKAGPLAYPDGLMGRDPGNRPVVRCGADATCGTVSW